MKRIIFDTIDIQKGVIPSLKGIVVKFHRWEFSILGRLRQKQLINNTLDPTLEPMVTKIYL